ncbi:MAG: hypothetical protein PHV82_19210, partial [Victivallaceae bacterium]|nr:hypothetical protein [Victivallaceae bacterium]
MSGNLLFILCVLGFVVQEARAELNWAHLQHGAACDYVKRGTSTAKEITQPIDGDRKKGGYYGKDDLLIIRFPEQRNIGRVKVYNAFAVRSGSKKLEYQDFKTGKWILIGSRPEGELINDFSFEPVLAQSLRITVLSEQISSRQRVHSLITEVEALDSGTNGTEPRKLDELRQAGAKLSNGTGDWLFNNGEYLVKEIKDSGILFSDASVADGTIETEVLLPGGRLGRQAQAGILFRVRNRGNSWYAFIIVTGSENKAMLIENDNGVWKLIAECGISLKSGKADTIGVEILNNTVSCFLNGRKLIGGRKIKISEGQCGIRATVAGTKFTNYRQHEVERAARVQLLRKQLKDDLGVCGGLIRQAAAFLKTCSL